MNLSELAKSVYEVSHLTGDFLLRSGQRSHEYFDKYQFESHPKILKHLASHMAKLIPPETEVLAGLEMGGIPIATALSLETGIPTAFVRKKAKSYGTCKISEGSEVDGKKVLIIEDVITTGGQVVESTKELRDHGAIIDTVVCAIYRGPDQLPEGLLQAGLKISPLLTLEMLKAHL